MGHIPHHRTPTGWHQLTADHINNGEIPAEHNDAIWEKHGQNLVDEHTAEDPDFKSAADKLGPEKTRKFAEQANSNADSWHFNGAHDDDWGGDDEQLKNLSDDEKNALSSFMLKHGNNVQHHAGEMLGIGSRPSEDEPYEPETDQTTTPAEEEQMEPEKPLPTHHVNTYSKRPKKLGMKEVDKKDILGDDPSDRTTKIQYAKLHKRLEELNQYITELKKK